MKDEIKKVRIGDLVIDEKLTELRHIDETFVNKYAGCMRRGDIFPLIITDRKTKKVISGNHRLSAMLKVFGKDHETEVILREFKDYKEIIHAFAQENSRHGNPLGGIDQRRIVFALRKYGETDEAIATSLGVSVKKVIDLGQNGVQVIIGKNRIETRPAKRGFKPNNPITEKQYKDHDHDPAFPVKSNCNILIRWLDQDLIDKNEDNFDALCKLYNSLESYIDKHGILKKVV